MVIPHSVMKYYISILYFEKSETRYYAIPIHSIKLPLPTTPNPFMVKVFKYFQVLNAGSLYTVSATIIMVL